MQKLQGAQKLVDQNKYVFLVKHNFLRIIQYFLKVWLHILHDQEYPIHIFIWDYVIKLDCVQIVLHLSQMSHNLDFANNFHTDKYTAKDVLDPFDCDSLPTYEVFGLHNLPKAPLTQKCHHLIIFLEELPSIWQIDVLLSFDLWWCWNIRLMSFLSCCLFFHSYKYIKEIY